MRGCQEHVESGVKVDQEHLEPEVVSRQLADHWDLSQLVYLPFYRLVHHVPRHSFFASYLPTRLYKSFSNVAVHAENIPLWLQEIRSKTWTNVSKNRSLSSVLLAKSSTPSPMKTFLLPRNVVTR
ncbi:hypothetical protein TCAL_07303 [Tigriopus californicus]|uniref:Uncharacterized protein n=1 Tax=Tigriopus californicus TaxID=6832 RepID=A0A553PPQ8_TIGCA|nr:hypothetical protein TCAL_07303 [Tigriopus californicus]|eukprot:TCALIF_07303-PA protein Name:"Protein of unknown function" AED:0.16 eAED:0.16 QI:34/1/1/1/0/0.33/3/149/124